ncbi:RNase J family beta-CASP ribonuclease [Candidatus Woesearchaeota archaeon]|nr:RNase J family beta-CASP ribonuclease [Candidatus Woesearchaeota archaeon]
MPIEICAVGGYEEVGKNMTAVRVDDDVIILDMGIHLPNWIKYTEQEDIMVKGRKELRAVKAIPNDKVIDDWKDKVRAIIPTHAHLDHIGAIPFLADRYDAPVLATPYTVAVLTAILKDEKIKLKNSIKTLSPNSVYQITDKIRVQLINITHSTPQTSVIAVHTPYGAMVYANDFKLDNNPQIGRKPNYEALKKLGKSDVKAAVIDSLYAHDDRKTPSELVAKEMLRDVMLGTNSQGKAVIVTTFSSHLARLKSIVEFAKKMNRKIAFLGRSLAKYVDAGEKTGIIKFSKEVKIAKFAKQQKRMLKTIMKEGKDKYVIVVTGHQGEPQSTLSKMVNGIYPFRFDSEDHVVFSCAIIPNNINIQNRKELEKQLHRYGVRIFKDIHVSGHAGREDLRDFVNMIDPEIIVPAHAEMEDTKAMTGLAKEMGRRWKILQNGQRLKL